jgi:hypothetical protein
MIKALGQAALGEANFRYVTALTDPQVRRLLNLKTAVALPSGEFPHP